MTWGDSNRRPRESTEAKASGSSGEAQRLYCQTNRAVDQYWVYSTACRDK